MKNSPESEFYNSPGSFARAITPRDELSRAVKRIPSQLTTHQVLSSDGFTCGGIPSTAKF